MLMTPAQSTSPRPSDAELEAGSRRVAARQRMEQEEEKRKRDFIGSYIEMNGRAAEPERPDTMQSLGFRRDTATPAPPRPRERLEKDAETAYKRNLESRITEAEARIIAKTQAAASDIIKPRDGEPPKALEARRLRAVNKILSEKGVAPIVTPDDLVGEIGMFDEASRSAARYATGLAKVPGQLSQVSGTLFPDGIPTGFFPTAKGLGPMISAAGAAVNRMIDHAVPPEGIQPSMQVQREGAFPDSVGSVPRWLMARGPETVGSLATSIIPGAAVGRVAGAGAGMATAMWLGTAQETGGAYEEALQGYLSQGVPLAQAQREAAIEGAVYGAISGVLEKFPAAEFILKNQEARRRLVRLGKGAFVEGSTEASQELAQALTQVVGGSAPDAMNGIGEKMLASGVLGGLAGGGANLMLGSSPKADPAVSPQVSVGQNPVQPPGEFDRKPGDVAALVESGEVTPAVMQEALAAGGLTTEEEAVLREALAETPVEVPQPSTPPDVSTAEQTAPSANQGTETDAAVPSPDPTEDEPELPDFLADIAKDEAEAQAPAPVETPGAPPAPPSQGDSGGAPVLAVRKGKPNEVSDAALEREILEGTTGIAEATDAALNPESRAMRAQGRSVQNIGDQLSNPRDGAMTEVREGFSGATPMERAFAPSEDALSDIYGGEVNEARKSAEYMASGKAGRLRRAKDQIKKGGAENPQANAAMHELELRQKFGKSAKVQVVENPDGLPVGATLQISGQTHRVESTPQGPVLRGDIGSVPLSGVGRIRIDAGTLDVAANDVRVEPEPEMVADDLPISPAARRSVGNVRRAVDPSFKPVAPRTASDRQAVAVGKALGLEVVLFEPGGAAEGVFDPANPNVIFVESSVSGDNVRRVVAHEWVHSLRRTDPAAFNRIAEAIERIAPGTLSQRVRAYNARAERAGTAQTTAVSARGLEEAVAETFTQKAKDTGYWSKLAGEEAKVWDRIVDALRRIVTRLGLRGREARALLRAIEGATPGRAVGGRGDPMLSPAWHGSPYTFNRFSTQKIGTGEGAQAYGYGLYFAGKKEVAEYYRESLAGKSLELAYDDGTPIDLAKLAYDPAVREAYAALKYWKGNFDTAISSVEGLDFKAGDVAESAAGKVLQRWMETGVKAKEKHHGRLYKVDLKPAEDEYLLWDKPLSEQSEKVRAAIEGGRLDTSYALGHKPGEVLKKVEPTGQKIYQRLSAQGEKVGGKWGDLPDSMGDKAASAYLRSLGIRGIKYLDGTSRGDGEGSYNYVIFDDADVEIEMMMSPSGPKRLIEQNKKAQAEREGNRTIGDPSKANPGTNETTRRVIDAARSLVEKRQRRQDATVRAEAAKRLNANESAERQRLLAAAETNEVPTDTDVHVGRMIVARDAQAFAENPTIEAAKTLQRSLDAYDLRGTETARALRARVDSFLTPQERYAQFVVKDAFSKSQKGRREERSIREKLDEIAASKRRMQKELDDARSELRKARDRADTAEGKAAEVEAQARRVEAMEKAAQEKAEAVKAEERKWKQRMQRLEDREAKLQVEMMGLLNGKGIDLAGYMEWLTGKGKPGGKGGEGKGGTPEREAGSGPAPRRMNYPGQQDLGGSTESGSLTVKGGPDVPRIQGDVSAQSVSGLQKNLPGLDKTLEGDVNAQGTVGKDRDLPGLSAVETAGEGFSGTDGEKGASGSQRVILTAGHVSLIKQVSQTVKGDKIEALREYWYNALICASHVTNVVTNFGYGSWRTVGQRFVEAMANAAAEVAGSKDIGGDAATLGEFSAMARVFLPALRLSWQNAVASFDSERMVFEDEIAFAQGDYESLKIGDDDRGYTRTVAIGGMKGRVIRAFGSRLSMASDEFYKGLWGNLAAAAIAHRKASAAGLRGEAKWNRVAELMADISSPIWGEALSEAKELTFQQSLEELGLVGKAGKVVQKAREVVPPIQIVVPFVKTPSNLIYQGAVRSTPLVTLQSLYRYGSDMAVKMGYKNGQMYYVRNRRRAVQDVAANLIAWGLWVSLYSLAVGDEPWITGTKPRGTAGGTPPMSIRFGGRWVSYSLLEPFASALALTVDSINRFQYGGDDSPLEAMLKSIGDTGDRLGNSVPMLTGIADLSTLIRSFGSGDGAPNTAQAASSWAANFAASWMPAIVRRALNEADPVQRDDRTLGLKGDSGAWGGFARKFAYRALGRLSPLDPPPIRYTFWGSPMEKVGPFGHPQSDWAYRLLVPARLAKPLSGTEQRLERAIVNWNRANPDKQFAKKPPDPFLMIDGKSVPMTDAEYERLMKETGQMALRGIERRRINELEPAIKDYDRWNKERNSAMRTVRERIIQDRRRKERKER